MLSNYHLANSFNSLSTSATFTYRAVRACGSRELLRVLPLLLPDWRSNWSGCHLRRSLNERKRPYRRAQGDYRPRRTPYRVRPGTSGAMRSTPKWPEIPGHWLGRACPLPFCFSSFHAHTRNTKHTREKTVDKNRVCISFSVCTFKLKG